MNVNQLEEDIGDYNSIGATNDQSSPEINDQIMAISTTMDKKSLRLRSGSASFNKSKQIKALKKARENRKMIENEIKDYNRPYASDITQEITYMKVIKESKDSQLKRK